jgi:acyl-CoA hydrolase
MQLSERIQNTETHQFRMILHNSLNDNGSLFGGFAMQWMDEVAYITAIRFTRLKVVTVAVDRLKFIKAVKPGEMAEIIGKVSKVGRVKLDIKVDIYVENSDSDQREKAVEASFTFAAVNKDNKPVCIYQDKWPMLDEKDSVIHALCLD